MSLEKLYDTHCGQKASHVSCLLAVEDECDVQHSSKIRSAIRHKLVQNELVDFTDIDTKKQDVRVLGWVLCVCSVGSWCDVRVLGWFLCVCSVS